MADFQFLHETYTQSMNDYDLAMQEEGLNIQRAAADGDTYAGRTASQALASLRVQKNEYIAMSRQHAASLRPAPGSSRFGLSPDEQTIAHGISGGDSRLTKDDREKLYAEQKAKLQHLRETGQYRDDPGRVSR
jgi:hypothetical protein